MPLLAITLTCSALWFISTLCYLVYVINKGECVQVITAWIGIIISPFAIVVISVCLVAWGWKGVKLVNKLICSNFTK